MLTVQYVDGNLLEELDVVEAHESGPLTRVSLVTKKATTELCGVGV